MTLAWLTPVSHNPMMLGIAVAKHNWTEELIRSNREFVINVPSVDMLEVITGCGTVSGRDVNKTKEHNLTLRPATKVASPVVVECFAHIECRVDSAIDVGDHTLFVAPVVAAAAKPGAFDGIVRIDNANIRTVHHLGGQFYASPMDIINAKDNCLS